MKKNSTKYAEKYQYFDVSTGKNADTISLSPDRTGNGKVPHNSRYHGIERDLKPERYDAAGSECALGHEEARRQSKAVNAAVSRGHHAVGQPPLCRAGHAAVECCAECVDMQNNDEEHSQCLEQVNAVQPLVAHFFCPALCCGEDVFHQSRARHRADAARHGRYERAAFGSTSSKHTSPKNLPVWGHGSWRRR